MADREARPSTDEERDSLLRDPTECTSRTLAERVNTYAQEPLTPLTKTLLILALVLLLTSSIFIGLFAGAQHRLSLGHDGKARTTVISATTTSTVTSAITSTVTSSITSTITSAITTTVTSTTIGTTTVIPLPVPTKPPEECHNPQCILLSASILSSLDLTQNPCENFYDFANGGWLKSHPLPADKSNFGNFEALRQENNQVIQMILESKSSVGSVDDEILLKLRNFYASCLDERGLDEIGIEPLLHVAKTIKRLYKGDDTDISSSHGNSDKVKGLTAAVAFLHSKGIDALFSFDIDGDVGVDPNHMVLWFSQPEFGLPSKEYFEEESVRKAYQAVVERLLVTLADAEDNASQQEIRRDSPVLVNNEDSDTWPPWPWPPWDGDDDGDEDEDDGGGKPVNKTLSAHELAKKIVKFEQKLAQASLDLDILQDPIATYNPVPLSNLTESVPQIHFPTYFSAFTPRAYSDRVIVAYPAYSVSLSNILNETSPDVIEAYLVSRAALGLSPYLGMSTEAWQAQRSLVELLTGIKKGAVGDRAEYCTGIVEDKLGFAVGRYFVNETFRDQAKEKGTKVITDIVEAFKSSLKTIDWMDTKSAKAAAEKADAIRVKVGYPISPNTEDPHSIASYYNSVKVVKDDFIGNILSSASSDSLKQWSKLNRPRDLDSWEMYPSTVNAYFNPPANEIVFPAGILQPPFFYSSWPGYLSYGAFGQVASHELTHAFDSSGRLYNQQGKLAQWWTNSTSEGFQVKQDCIIKQFSSYAIDDGKGGKIHVNGNLTSGENIGDTGLIQAYRAWKAQYETSLKDGNEYILPGLNYTRDQLFFISFARIWARAIKPAAAVQRIRTDPHSPTRFRVDGTVSNIPEFAEAFKCSKKAKLNPPNADRCIFWS